MTSPDTVVILLTVAYDAATEGQERPCDRLAYIAVCLERV